MKKQIVIMLLMAIAAVMLMTVACGSSDDPTDLPGTTRSGTDTSEPASNSQNQNEDRDSTPDTKDTDTPQVVNTPQIQGSSTTPWPTSAPTRVNTRATVSNPDRTSMPQPTEPTPDSAEDNPARPPVQEPPPPSYDGASPLIHVFFDQPWIIIPSIKGQTYKPALKGLTQNGEIVSIDDPAMWEITFERTALNPWGKKEHPFLTTPDGTITLTSSEPTDQDFYEYLDAHHNGNVTSIYVYHNTVDDKVITLTDPTTATKGYSWWIGDCFYGMRHDGAYKEAFHHASASVLTKDQETLETVYKEARKLGYEPTFVRQYESGATYTHLQPPRNQCIPLEEAYRLAKEINKIPGVQRLEWLTAESGRLKEYRERLAIRNEE